MVLLNQLSQTFPLQLPWETSDYLDTQNKKEIYVHVHIVHLFSPLGSPPPLPNIKKTGTMPPKTQTRKHPLDVDDQIPLKLHLNSKCTAIYIHSRLPFICMANVPITYTASNFTGLEYICLVSPISTYRSGSDFRMWHYITFHVGRNKAIKATLELLDLVKEITALPCFRGNFLSFIRSHVIVS